MRFYSDDRALWMAAKRGDSMRIRYIVGSRPDARLLLDRPHPLKGSTPLMVAAKKKWGAEAVRVLLELGAHPDVVDSGRRGAALHYAAARNRVAQLELLLNAGANPFVRNRRGLTPLDLARMHGRRDACALLSARMHMARAWCPKAPQSQQAIPVATVMPLATSNQQKSFPATPTCANTAFPQASMPLRDVGAPAAGSGRAAAGGAQECSICMDKPRDAVCVPCGHVAGCYTCLQETTKRDALCPICRAQVQSVVKMFDC